MRGDERMKEKRRVDFWTIVTCVLALIFLVFLVYPIGGLLKEAFVKDGAFSLDGFAEFFSKKHYYGTIGHSTMIGICVTVFSLLIGIPFSYFYTFYLIRLKQPVTLFIIFFSAQIPMPM